MKPIFTALLRDLPEGQVMDVCVALNWTAVVVEIAGERRCGLASTLRVRHHHIGEPTIPEAGSLIGKPASELAAYLKSGHPTRSSLGLAAVNALLRPHPEHWIEQHGEDTILKFGEGKRVALIGHFPFVPHLRTQIEHLDVLELDPSGSDLPASAAPQVLPQAEVVAITGMTLHNGTLEKLLHLCHPKARIILLGPSTPLSPVLFDYGIDILAGAVVEQVGPVFQVVSQGGNFRQVRRAGVRLVSWMRQ